MVTLVGEFLSRVPWRAPREEQRMRGHVRYVSSSRMPIRRLAIACPLFAVAFLAASLSSTAQTPSAGPRILAPSNEGALTTVRGNTHPLARAGFDQGKVESAMPMSVTIAFKMTAAQQADLDALLASQQDRGSPDYQRWLTPEQFGRRFGLSQADVSKVTGWLQSEGFQVEPMPASRNMIAFRGTAQQVEAALHTEMHHYAVNGKAHFANASDPSVPAALADVVSGVRGLNNFQLKPRAMRKVSPRFTSGQTGNHFIAPGDFATIYDETALYTQGFNGTGQKIVVVGQSDIQLSDIAAFRNNSGLPANPPQIVHVPRDADPGMLPGDIDEANLDVEWAGATAPMATVIFIVGDPINGGGVFDSLQYAITASPIPGPVISMSYGACEQEFSPSDIAFLASLTQQANAEGITILASSGDSGAADCDRNSDPSNPTAASTLGLAVDVPGSLASVTSVGGTEFAERADLAGTFWVNSVSIPGADVTPSSARSYIPEGAWNDTSASFGLTAGGGGTSTVIPKQAWQAGAGVPNDGARDVPDISLSASPAHDAFLACSENFDSTTHTFSPTCPTSGSFRNTDGTLTAFGGTSLGPPAFAGILAIINQQTHSSGQGNINAILYPLATHVPTAFHDVVSGNNRVPFQSTSMAGCGTSSVLIGYSAQAGYDLATGLGSIDALNLVTNWTSVSAASNSNAAASVDFQLAFSNPQITVQRGACGSAQLQLTPLNGFSGTPTFSCTVASNLGATACSLAPVAAASLYRPGKFNNVNWWVPAGVTVTLLLACVTIIFNMSKIASVDNSERTWAQFVPVLSLIVLAAIGLSCSGGTSSTSTNGSNGGANSGSSNGGSNSSNGSNSSTPPSITAQPTSQSIAQGQIATFSVTASGTAPLSYQWSKNGAPIGGATAAAYTTPATTSGDQGEQFSVTVSNAAGNATSNSAVLTLYVPYNLTVQVPSTVAAGSGTLTVTGKIGGINHSAQITVNAN